MLRTSWTWLRMLAIVVCLVLGLWLMLAAAIAFGAAAPPRPVHPRQMDLTELAALSRYTTRDGAQLAYRVYPGNVEQVVVLIHGSGTESSVMNALAKTLQAAGATVYALDLRGHGSSGRSGDIDYIGQLDDDLAASIATVRPEHANAALTLIGFSAGGAFTILIAGGASRRFLRSIHRDLPGDRLSVTARASERRWLGDALPASDRGPDHSQ